MSDVLSTIIARRTVYKFQSKAVPKSVLEDAFEAARHAPCHKHTHPWKFYVLGPATRKKLIPAVERLAKLKAGSTTTVSPEVIERARQKMLSPPVMIAVTSKRSADDAFREQEDYAASVCALHNAVLFFWDQGVGCQWSTGGITRDEDLYGALDIVPDSERIIGLLKAGYPESIPSVKKKDVDEIRFYLE